MKVFLRYAISLTLISPCPGDEWEELATLSQVSAGRDQVSYNQWLATSFEVGEDALPIEITSLTLRARVLVPNENVYVAIHQSEHFRPSQTNASYVFDAVGLGSADVSATSQDFTMSPILDPEEPVPLLSAGERYWIVFGVAARDFDQTLSTGLYEWDFVSSSPPEAVGRDLNFGDWIATSNTAGQEWAPTQGSPQSLSMSYVAVPEPGFGGLVFLSALVMLGKRCRS